MPFKMDNDQLVPTYFRVTVATTGFATGAATSGGGVTPNPSKLSSATTGPYFLDTDGSGTKGVTKPTTDAKCLERERGNIRFERLLDALAMLGGGFSVRDVGITEANGDALGASLTMTIGNSSWTSPNATSIDGSTSNTTAILKIKETVAQSLNNGSTVAAANGNTITVRNRMVYTVASDDTISMQDVVVGNPHTTGEIFDNITVVLETEYDQIDNQTGTDGVQP